MKDEESLSDKIIETHDKELDYLNVEDVKEAVKKLKDEVFTIL